MAQRTSIIPLRDAGYRERAFVKSALAVMGQMGSWKHALENWRYNHRHDMIVGGMAEPGWKVSREGDESARILESWGYDDTDC